MTVIYSGGSPQALPERKSFPFPAGPSRSSGPTKGSIPVLGSSNLAYTYESMVRSQPWVYAVVTKLVYGIARLPLPVYRSTVDDGREADKANSLYTLLKKPQPYVGPFGFKAEMAWNLFVHGRALTVKFRNNRGQEPTELWNVPWPMVKTVEDASGVVGFVVVIEGREYPVPRNDAIYYSLPGGISPLEPLRRTLAIEDASLTWQAASLENGITPRGSFVTDQRISENTLPRLRKELESLYAGPENAGRFGLFDQGLKWEAMGQSASDAQLLETRLLNREEVAAAYDVSPPLVGILDKANYATVYELHKALYTDTLGPRLTLIEEAQQAQLIDPEGVWDGLFVEFNLNEVLKPDPEARFRTYLISQQAGVLTINERRKAENLPPIDHPLADAVMAPLNMTPVGEGLPMPDLTPDPQAGQEGVGAPQTDPVTAALLGQALGDGRPTLASQEVSDDA